MSCLLEYTPPLFNISGGTEVNNWLTFYPQESGMHVYVCVSVCVCACARARVCMHVQLVISCLLFNKLVWVFFCICMYAYRTLIQIFPKHSNKQLNMCVYLWVEGKESSWPSLKVSSTPKTNTLGTDSSSKAIRNERNAASGKSIVIFLYSVAANSHWLKCQMK